MTFQEDVQQQSQRRIGVNVSQIASTPTVYSGTGPLWGQSTGDQWIPAQIAENTVEFCVELRHNKTALGNLCGSNHVWWATTVAIIKDSSLMNMTIGLPFQTYSIWAKGMDTKFYASFARTYSFIHVQGLPWSPQNLSK